MNLNEFGQELKDIFANVNMWLHFAEAKNIGVITVCALAFTLSLPCLTKILLGVSILLALLSFYPNLSNSPVACSLFRPIAPSTTDNLVFYNDIQKYQADEYLKALQKKCGFDQEKPDIFLDYATEIVINSKIAVFKYTMFQWSLAFLLGGLFLKGLCFLFPQAAG